MNKSFKFSKYLFTLYFAVSCSYAFVMGEDDREVATLSELQEPGIRQTGLIRIDDEDPGVYGKEGLRYHSRKHKNYAVSIHGEFHKALQTELEASARRAMGYGD